jgi:hypothetical protein
MASLAPSPALAAKAPPPAPVVRHEDAPAAPVVSVETDWLRPALVVAAALFVAAVLIGPIYRHSLPEELLPTHSHDEPPGASHHHGVSGTVDFSAPERRH